MAILTTGLFAQTTVSVTADKDNTLFESATGALSNGAGANLFFGKTQSSSLNRRAVLHFDLSAAAIPAGATISSATLTINVNKVRGGNDSAFVHRITSDWGEGTSNAPGQQGGGTSAATNDATWVHAFFNATNWTTMGGDYIASPSAGTTVSGTGTVTISSAGLAADVQAWFDGTNSNFGWIIVGNEGRSGSAKRIASRENASTSARPTLTITYLSTGIAESTQSEVIQIYPSPADEYLVIEHRRNVFTNQARVIDLNGKEVINTELDMSNRINVSDLSTGVYFLELVLESNGERVTKKFFKN